MNRRSTGYEPAEIDLFSTLLNLVPAQGFEPRFAQSKCVVLPLDEAGSSNAVVGAAGAESNPRPIAYKATALPLSYGGACQALVVRVVVRAAGFEPAISAFQVRQGRPNSPTP